MLHIFASVFSLCCKHFEKDVFGRTLQQVFYLDVTFVSHILQVFYLDVAYVLHMLQQYVSSVSDVCCIKVFHVSSVPQASGAGHGRAMAPESHPHKEREERVRGKDMGATTKAGCACEAG
jgi:hypothetical protein